jgi:RNA polymerase sigma factor (TIGR02999 family)
MNEPLDQKIYLKLKAVANKLMLGERQNHTLSPTDLVHEAFLKLPCAEGYDRASYFFVLARQMRRLLVDYGRKTASMKRGGDVNRVVMTDSLGIADDIFQDFTPINSAIEELEQLDERAARAIDLYYFTDISRKETAEILNISVPTLERDLRFAKTHINHYLKKHAI